MLRFYKYVWLSTQRRQIILIMLAIIAAGLAMLPLELQRHIINTLAGHEKPDALVLLCAGYLAAAWAISTLRYLLNTKSAALGESAILALRQDIHGSGKPVSRELQGGAHKVDQTGTVIAMISSEAETVGKVAGECISTPLIQIGTFLSVLIYMLWTEPKLGLVVLLIAIPQVVITPLVQQRINALVRTRVGELRHVGDIVADEMRTATNNQHDEVFQGFQNIFGIRLRIFKLKFGMKLTVNGLQSLGVFTLLLVGGLMVLHGQTEIGIVVAFISGLDRVGEPLRELIVFLRSISVATVQFDMIMGTSWSRTVSEVCRHRPHVDIASEQEWRGGGTNGQIPLSLPRCCRIGAGVLRGGHPGSTMRRAPADRRW